MKEGLQMPGGDEGEGGFITPSFPRFRPIPHRYNNVGVYTYINSQHMKILKHFYTSNIDVRYRVGWFRASKHDTTMLFGLRLMPSFPKFCPILHRCNNGGVHPYTHPQHMKMLKHFILIHIQCGCEMQIGVLLSVQT